MRLQIGMCVQFFPKPDNPIPRAAIIVRVEHPDDGVCDLTYWDGSEWRLAQYIWPDDETPRRGWKPIPENNVR